MTVEHLPLGGVGETVGFDAVAQFFGDPQLFLQLGLGGFLADALLGELAGLLANLGVQPFERAAQGRQHRLLAFDLRGALGQPGRGRIQFDLLSLEPFVLGTLSGEGGIQLPSLFFQFQRVALQLLALAVHVGGRRVRLPLALFQRFLESVEPSEVGPMSFLVGNDLLLAPVALGLPGGQFLRGDRN